MAQTEYTGSYFKHFTVQEFSYPNVFIPYPDNHSTWNLINFPSKLAGFTRSSVISIHSFSWSSDFRNNTLTRHVVGSGSNTFSCRSESGNWMVIDLENWTVSKQLIRSIGPRKTPVSWNSSLGTSWTCFVPKNNRQQSTWSTVEPQCATTPASLQRLPPLSNHLSNTLKCSQSKPYKKNLS